MSRLYGLIGFPLSHSFSQKYFREKFQREGIHDAEYRQFEIEHIGLLSGILGIRELRGLNVTIPYKQKVIPFLNHMDPLACRIGAVNVIRIEPNGERSGFNSDYYGFRSSLEKWLAGSLPEAALILGTGGAAKAVQTVLEDMNIRVSYVSRKTGNAEYTYADLRRNTSILEKHRLLINTTPLGMAPETERHPDIPFELIGNEHYLYDLIYNPPVTRWMELAQKHGAQTKNGMEMLVLQAEKSWEIWNA